MWEGKKDHVIVPPRTAGVRVQCGRAIGEDEVAHEVARDRCRPAAAGALVRAVDPFAEATAGVDADEAAQVEVVQVRGGHHGLRRDARGADHLPGLQVQRDDPQRLAMASELRLGRGAGMGCEDGDEGERGELHDVLLGHVPRSTFREPPVFMPAPLLEVSRPDSRCANRRREWPRE